jgi:hypothetical protein
VFKKNTSQSINAINWKGRRSEGLPRVLQGRRFSQIGQEWHETNLIVGGDKQANKSIK